MRRAIQRGSGLPSAPRRLSQGGVVPAGEPALLASEAMDGEAQPASSERSPGWAQGTSGDAAGTTPTHHA
jgi:hypothetical protein